MPLMTQTSFFVLPNDRSFRQGNPTETIQDLETECFFKSRSPVSYLDTVQDQPYISVPNTFKIQSGPRVVKMVLNTQSISVAYNVISCKKKSKETLKKSKSPILLLYKFSCRAQKSTKTDHSIVITFIFL